LINRAWKAKARKMLSPPYKKLDLAKLQALALEGNTIVLTSRVKENLREVISGHVAPSAQEASSEDAGAAGLGKGAKRGVKTATEPSGAPPTAAASWSGETWGTLIRASGVEDCASSDEEDLQEKIDLARASGAELAAPQLRVSFTFCSYKTTPGQSEARFMASTRRAPIIVAGFDDNEGSSFRNEFLRWAAEYVGMYLDVTFVFNVITMNNFHERTARFT
jgi:hypothetical protein